MEQLRVSRGMDDSEVRSDGQDEEGAAVCSNLPCFSLFGVLLFPRLFPGVSSPSFRRVLRFSLFPVSFCGAVEC